MTARELIESLGVIAEAPDGVKRLRELVLQLAVRGKLVAQDPGEEAAAVLLAKISKGNKAAVHGTPQAPPHDLPASWSWTTLPAIASYAVGRTPPTKDSRFWSAEGIPWVSIGDITDGETVSATARSVTPAAAKEVFRSAPVPAGTMLMSFKLTIGKMGRLGIAAYHNEAIISIRPYSGICDDYLFLVLPTAARGGESKDAIKGATLNGDSLARFPIPLPPLAEQHRIVAKVDELMVFLDKLEAAKAARDATRTALRDAALAQLRDADGPDEVEVAWGRIAGQMQELFSQPEDVGPLRQAVLQLAVRGRLVRQEVGDEPASNLLDRIAQSLTKRAGASKGISVRSADGGVPFAVAEGWEWCRLGEILQECRNGTSLSPNDAGVGFRLLRISAATGKSNGLVDLDDYKFVDAPLDAVKSFFVAPGDLLSCRFNGNLHYVGSVAVVPKVGDAPVAYPDKLIRLRAPEMDQMYLRYAMNSETVRKQVEAGAATTAGNIGINGAQVRSWLVPIPPLAEQHRIVSKVDELMGFLDNLETRLKSARDLQAAFAAAAVHHLES